MHRAPHPPVPRGLLAGVFIVVVSFYWLTLCPTVHWDDSGELITAAYVAGISHPPGQPLYAMIGWVFTHLPGLPSPAYGMNFLSALLGGITWMLIAGWIWDIQRRHGRPPGLAAAVAALTACTGAVGAITWYQSVIAENTTLHSTFIAALVWWAWRLGTGPRLEDGPLLRRMLAWAFVYGLSATNHPAGVFLFPALAGWFIFTQGPRMLRPHWVAAMLVCAGVGLLPYSYLYFASKANPPLDWGNPETWENFMWVVTAQQYQADAFRQLTPAHLLAGCIKLLDAVFTEWTVLGGAALGAGWLFLCRRDLPLAVWPLAALTVFIYLSTNPAYIGAYLVPAFIFLTPALAEAFATVGAWLGRRGAAPAWALALGCAVPGTGVALHWDANNLRGDDLAKRYGEFVLGQLPPGAILVTESANLRFVALYLTLCEGYRSDVVLITANGLTRPGYQTTVKRRYPELRWPDQFARIPELDPAGSALQGTVVYTLNPWWVKELLIGVYDANGTERRAFWEDITPYGAIVDRFVQAGYLHELRRPLSGERQAAWATLPGSGAELVIPEPWDPRAADSPGGRTVYSNAIAVVGNAWRMRGAPAKAAEAYAVALALNPEMASIQTNAGVVLQQLGRYAEAERALLAGVALRPEDGAYAANLGTFYARRGWNREALHWYRQSVTQWPNAPWSFLASAAELELQSGEPARALPVLERALAARPDHLPTAANLATVALRLHEPDRAKPAVDAALKLDPASAVAWFNAAWLAADTGQDDAHVGWLLDRAAAIDGPATRQRAAGHPRLAQLLRPATGAPGGDTQRQPIAPNSP